MSVPTFIETTVEEQCQDLRWYLKQLDADISEENSDEGFLIDLQQIIGACDVVLRDSNESVGDIESVLNSIVSLLFMIPVGDSDNLVYSFCEKLSKATTNKMGMVCLRVLQNLFEGLGDRSLCYDVYFSLIKVAGQTDSIHLVCNDLNKLKSWLTEQNISTEKVQKLLRLLHETLVESKQSGDLASKVMVELLSTYTEDNASQARDDAHRCIVTCLGDPNTFLMDHLLALKPVRFLEGELIHDLLTIFVSEKLSSYMQFYATNKDFVHSLGLSHEQNMHKMRLLTFMQMAENKKELTFESMQSELHLKFDEVEAFIIDALRTKMVRAKIDQMQKKVLVSSTMHRTFGKPQWQQLREIFTRWRSNLGSVDSCMQTVIHAQFEQIPSLQA